MSDAAGRQLQFRAGDMPPVFGDTAAVLVVDDDTVVGKLLDEILKPEGYKCTVVVSAAEARAAAAEREFAVALVDILMPGETGLELVADLTKRYPDLAVVMVSAVDDPSIAELALEAGAEGYILKPFRDNDVVITVNGAGLRRCLTIEQRLREQRLERIVAERDQNE